MSKGSKRTVEALERENTFLMQVLLEHGVGSDELAYAHFRQSLGDSETFNYFWEQEPGAIFREIYLFVKDGRKPMV